MKLTTFFSVGRRLSILFLAIGLFVTCFRPNDITEEWRERTFYGPFQTLRTYYAPISLLLFFGGTVLMVVSGPKLYIRRAYASIVAFMLFQGYLLFRNGMDESTGPLTKLTSATALLALIIFIAASAESLEEGICNLLRPFVWCGLVTPFCMGLQAMVDKSPLVWQGEVMGFSGHSQHFGVACAAMLGASLSLVKMEKEFLNRWSAIISALCMAVMTILSGSRTALLASIVAVAAMWAAGSQKKIFILLATTCGLTIVGFFFLLQTDSDHQTFGELFNREYSWASLWRGFLEHPFIGNGSISASESGYLVMLAVGGLIAAFIFGLFVLILGIRLFVIFNGKNETPVPIKQFLAFAFTYIIIASIFEGFMIQVIQAYSIGILFGMTAVYATDLCYASIINQSRIAKAKTESRRLAGKIILSRNPVK